MLILRWRKALVRAFVLMIFVGAGAQSFGQTKITTCDQLEAIGNSLSGNYELDAHIDANKCSIQPFIPVGDYTAPFTGVFDGKGYSISNVNITNDNLSTNPVAIGLFSASSGTISNVRVTNITIHVVGAGTHMIGGLVGFNTGQITNSTVTGVINANLNSGGSSDSLFAGGLVGYNDCGFITLSQSDTSVLGANSNLQGDFAIGGLVGVHGVSNPCGGISDSFSGGQVTMGQPDGSLLGFFVGGLIGQSVSPLVRSYATGNVVGGSNTYIGGLVGETVGAKSEKLRATGNVTGGSGSFVGGLVGRQFWGLVEQSSASGGVVGGDGSYVGGLTGYGGAPSNIASIDQSYSTGHLKGGSGATIGGLVSVINGTVTNSYWDTTTSGVPMPNSGDTSKGVGVVTADLKCGVPPRNTACDLVAGFVPTDWEPMHFTGVSPAVDYYPQLWALPFPIRHFPLADYTPYNIPIYTIFDHSPQTKAGSGILEFYSGNPANPTCDRLVLAFDGSQGRLVNGTNEPTCNRAGYKQASGKAFHIHGLKNYLGSGSDPAGDPADEFLNYEGHPGYDYQAPMQTPVLAAVSGVVFYPWNAKGTGDASKYYTYCRDHALALVPDSAPTYRLYYLHLATHPARIGSNTTPVCNDTALDTAGATLPFTAKAGCNYGPKGAPPPTTLPLAEGTHVDAGCQIAFSGDAGVPGSPHLHFEIQQIAPAMALASSANAINSFFCWQEKPPYSAFNSGAYCLPADPYGWTGPSGGDFWANLSGVASRKFWVP